MARPKNKTELLTLREKNFEFLMEFIEGLPKNEQQAEFTKGTLNRNIKDILMHLHHWHLMMMDWYAVGMKGNKPDMPAKGYTWKTVPQLNKWIWEKYKDTPLEDAKSSIRASYKKVKALIDKHSNDELFEKRRFSWTGFTSLGAYFISASSSHYDWAIKLIRKARK